MRPTYQKTCRCGKRSTAFYMDIGPYYMDDCCKDAGYNEKGELVTSTVEVPTEVAVEKKKRQYYKSGQLKKKNEQAD